MPWHVLLQQTQPYTAMQERHTERGPPGIPLPGGENSPTPGFRQAHALILMGVEVDTLLGKIRPLHAWTGIAAGKIFVPALARQPGSIQDTWYRNDISLESQRVRSLISIPC